MSEADTPAPGAPIPLDDALVAHLRDLAALAGDGAIGGVDDQYYRHQATIGVPSTWLVEIIDRMRVAELHCGYRKRVGKSPGRLPGPAAADVASAPALTVFERAQLRATAVSMLVDPCARDTVLDHPSFARAVELVVGWLVAPAGTPYPTIHLSYFYRVRPDPLGVNKYVDYYYSMVASGSVLPIRKSPLEAPEGLL